MLPPFNLLLLVIQRNTYFPEDIESVQNGILDIIKSGPVYGFEQMDFDNNNNITWEQIDASTVTEGK